MEERGCPQGLGWGQYNARIAQASVIQPNSFTAVYVRVFVLPCECVFI